MEPCPECKGRVTMKGLDGRGEGEPWCTECGLMVDSYATHEPWHNAFEGQKPRRFVPGMRGPGRRIGGLRVSNGYWFDAPEKGTYHVRRIEVWKRNGENIELEKGDHVLVIDGHRPSLIVFSLIQDEEREVR